MVCIEYVDPTKDGSFVVGRTATVETACLGIVGQFERREVPAVCYLCLQKTVGMTCEVEKRITDWLHVIVTVNENRSL